MHQKVQDLVDTLYREGVQKADQKSREIIEEARSRALEIVQEAEAKAAKIIADADAAADASMLRAKAEIQLTSRQVLSDLKRQISDMILYQIAANPAQSLVDSPQFLADFFMKVWDIGIPGVGKEDPVSLIFSTEMEKNLRIYLESRFSTLLKEGLTLIFSDEVRSGFQIRVEGKGISIQFSEEDFQAYFRMVSRPAIYQMLFGENR
jgi:V/A-type H+/Na+-transporting ATPase subunit E